MANYKSLVQCYIQKGVVPSNHRERFEIWFLIIQFVEDVSAGRSWDKIGILEGFYKTIKFSYSEKVTKMCAIVRMVL